MNADRIICVSCLREECGCKTAHHIGPHPFACSLLKSVGQPGLPPILQATAGLQSDVLMALVLNLALWLQVAQPVAGSQSLQAQNGEVPFVDHQGHSEPTCEPARPAGTMSSLHSPPFLGWLIV